MSSMFVIFLDGERVERIYSGNAAEQFAAYVADFPIGCGAHLSYTRSLDRVEPLVRLG